MSEYFLKLKFSGANVEVESDSSSYATEVNLKNAIGVDLSGFT